MEEKNKIGNRIKYLRETAELTQKQLAVKLGLSGETAVANYESGYSIPKDNIKLRLCDIFDCTLDYLMCKTDIKNIENEFKFAYHKEIEGLTEQEIKDALAFYKKIKYGKGE